jgi:hypothetical protein
MIKAFHVWMNGVSLAQDTCVKWISLGRIDLKRAIGRLFNLAGLPGFVRPCDYKASIATVDVSVRTHGLFTIITVNDLDIYFTRLTGAIDGIGFSPNADCKQGQMQESTDLDGPPVATVQQQPQIENQSEHSE